MIIEPITIGLVISTFSAIDKSVKMDEHALKKYAKAFEKNTEAKLMVNEKAEYTDKRLLNVARKKRAIITRTIPRFVEVYSQIQKVKINQKEEVLELPQNILEDRISSLNLWAISTKKEFTDKELVCGLLMKGFNKMIIKDSERSLSAARNQLSIAEVNYSQAESICVAYDAIIMRADRMAKLLAGMNLLFLKSINMTEETIKKNGFDVRNYSDYDKQILMTCVNFAAALSELINVPVVSEDGQITEAAMETIKRGELYITKMNDVLLQD